MCFVSFISSKLENEIGSSLVRQVASTRGPDDFSSVRIEGIGTLSHGLLTITQPKTTQPLSVDHLHLAVNGQIYGWLKEPGLYVNRPAEKNDSQWLLDLICEFGPDYILPRIVGMFAVIIVDQKQSLLWVARDSIGEKPLFEFRENESLVLSSSFELFRPLRSKLTISESSVAHFFAYGNPGGENCIFREVNFFPANIVRCYACRDGSVCHLADYPLLQGDSDSIEFAESVLKSAIPSDDCAVAISGGCDSTFVAAMASGLSNERSVLGISCRYNLHDESGVATKNAQRLGMQVDVVKPLKPASFFAALMQLPVVFGYPYGNTSAVYAMEIAREAKKRGVKILLTGDGGDEISGSYLRHKYIDYIVYLHASVLRLPLNSCIKMARSLINIVTSLRAIHPNIAHWLLKLDAIFSCVDPRYIPTLISSLSFGLSDNALSLLATRLDQIDSHGLRQMDLDGYLRNDGAPKFDRAAIAFGVESRAPLFLLSRINSGRLNHLFANKKYFRDYIARVGCSIPKKKRGFGEDISIYFDAGIFGDITPWVRASLSRSEVLNVLDSKVVAEVIKSIDMKRCRNPYLIIFLAIYGKWVMTFESDQS